MPPDNDDRMRGPGGIDCVSLRPAMTAQAIELPAGIELVACRFAIEAGSFEALSASGASLPGALERAPLRRQVEFLAGRRCAAVALRAAGCQDGAMLPIGPRRTPLWPTGFIGSISHEDGLAVAIAADRGRVVALGVDVQRCPSPELAERLAPLFSVAGERQLGEGLPFGRVEWITRLWAIKESLIKALDGQRPTNFLELEVVAADRRTATVRLQGGPEFQLDHAAVGGHVLALCLLG